MAITATQSRETRKARNRLDEIGVLSDVLFSLRLEACACIYGVREGRCLRIIWFDPHHCERETGRAAYDWSKH
jgi:hypothetical protein